MLEEMKEQQKARDLRKRREQSAKEAAAVLQVVISERNHSLGGGYIELSATARNAKTAALSASKREETLQRMRQLKKKIGDRVAGRKSLMEQHDEVGDHAIHPCLELNQSVFLYVMLFACRLSPEGMQAVPL